MSLQQEQSFSTLNAFSNFDLISKQMQILSNTIFATVNIKINRLKNELCQLLKTITQFSINSELLAKQFSSNRNLRQELAKRITKN